MPDCLLRPANESSAATEKGASQPLSQRTNHSKEVMWPRHCFHILSLQTDRRLRNLSTTA